MNLHTFSNGWIAWVEPDSVSINSMFTSKGDKFIIVGFLLSGQFYIAPSFYNSAEEAQDTILTFDQQAITLQQAGHLIKVSACFNGSY